MCNRRRNAFGCAWLLLLLLWLCDLIVCHVSGMQIPPDVEILDGYEFDESPEYYSADTNYHELRHLAKGLNNAVRNKRSIDAYDQAKAAANQAKSQASASASAAAAAAVGSQTVEGSPIEVREVQELNDSPARPPPLPRAEKQVMDPDYDYYAQRRLGNIWHDSRTTSSMSAAEADTMAEASTYGGGGGARGRQARVNFITQPKKDAELAQELNEPPTLLTKVGPSPLKVSGGGIGGGVYEGGYGMLPAPPAQSPYYNYNYDVYPSRSYDPYLRRYDRSYDEQYARYDPYNYEDQFVYRRHYDPYDSYSPRMPQYPEPYYNYPDRRYDLPEPRGGVGDYVPLYTNDLYDKSPYPAGAGGISPAASMKYPIGTATSSGSVGDYGRQHRRIVYYAHLPEIVRTPYDYATRYDHERFDGLLTPAKSYSGAYKYDKPGLDRYGGGGGVGGGIGGSSNVGGGGIGGGGVATHRPTDDPYDYMKRDKKGNATPKPGKPGAGINISGRQ